MALTTLALLALFLSVLALLVALENRQKLRGLDRRVGSLDAEDAERAAQK